MAIEFTVDHKDDVADDSGITPLIGWVTATVETRPGNYRVRDLGGPVPSALKLLPRKGYLAANGHMYADESLAAPFRLVANDPAFNLRELTYRFDFDLTTLLGVPVDIPFCRGPAPVYDTTLQLARLMNDLDQLVIEVRTKGYAGDILDAKAVGVAVVTADDPAAARHALGGINNVVLSFADYGACDGVTNDRAAFATALADLAAAGGGELLLPPSDIALTLNAHPTFNIPANTKITGAQGATRLLLTSTDNNTYVSFAGSAGDAVVFDGVTFVRNSDSTLIFFYPGATNGFHLRNCVIDGKKSTYGTKTVHGISTEQAGAKGNITLKGCTVTGVGFGYLQSNSAAGTIDTFVVDDCTFDGNYADDLEFNAPAGTMRNVSVTNSRFTNNQSTNVASALGIGLAHVTTAVVRDCYFQGYYSDAIHLEDWCQDVTISGNTIVNCGTDPGSSSSDLDRAGITVMTGCSDVVITGNTLDFTANTNSLHGIVAKNLGGATTPGGRSNIPPFRITVTDNIIRCGSTYQGMWLQSVDDLIVRGNTVVGGGSVSGGVYSGNNGFGLAIHGGSGVVSANKVSGFRYGISGPFHSLVNDAINPPWTSRQALGNFGSVSTNTVSNCYLGIVAVPAGATNISANMMSNCVRPLLVGENGYTALPAAVSGNFADTNCTYPMEVGGRHIVIRSAGGSTVTVGTGKTINVDDTFLRMPVGTQIKFSGGGILTLTTAVNTTTGFTAEQPYIPGSPYGLVGDVSGASIGAGEYGIVTGLVYSATTANNQARIAGNTDSSAGYFLPAMPNDSTIVGTTATGGSGTEDGAGTWTKIATFNLKGDFAAAKATLSVTLGASGLESAIVTAHARSTTTGNNNSIGVAIIAKPNTTAFIATNAFKMVTGLYGTVAELWFKKSAAAGNFNVVELAHLVTPGSSITYYANSAWQSATPSGVVESVSAGLTSFGLPVATTTGAEVFTNKDLTSGTNTFPTLNQNTTGSAAKLTTPRLINGVAFDGSANITTGDVDSLAGAVQTLPRWSATGIVTTSTGNMILGYFLADQSLTAANVTVCTNSTAAAATPTLCRIGLFSVDGSGNLTLIASTANDTSLFAATFTVYTRALSASVALTAGSLYALGILTVSGAACPSFYGASSNATLMGASPRRSGFVTGQTDLPSSVAVGSISNTGNVPYIKATT